MMPISGVNTGAVQPLTTAEKVIQRRFRRLADLNQIGSLGAARFCALLSSLALLPALLDGDIQRAFHYKSLEMVPFAL